MINDLKDLEKLFKICRKQGVETIQIQGIAVSFSDMVPGRTGTDDAKEETTEELSAEDLMYYAVQGQA